MKFYKVVFQFNSESLRFKKILMSNNLNYIEGNVKGSFAIEYSPEKYTSILSNNSNFKIYQEDNIRQLIVTNQKYRYLMNISNKLDLDLVDYKLEDFIEMIEEDLDINHKIYYLMSEYDVQISELVYRTHLKREMIYIQRNGVIGFDTSLQETLVLKNLIDLLNTGNKLIL